MVYQILLGAVFCSLGWSQQLKLICANPEGNQSEPDSARMVTISPDGRLSHTALSPDKSIIWWLSVSLEDRKAVLEETWTDAETGKQSGGLKVLDLARGTVAKVCERPKHPTRMSPVGQWFFRTATGELAYVDDLAGTTSSGYISFMQAFNLSDNVPCAASFSKVEPEEGFRIVASGIPGVVSLMYDGTYIHINKENGGLQKPISGREVPLGFTVPPFILGVLKNELATIVINNNDMLVVSLNPEAGQEIAVYRKRDGKWLHRLHPRSVVRSRAFGPYFVGIDAETVGAGRRTNPGSKAWRSTQGLPGYQIGRRLAEDKDKIYPGRIFIYDVEKEKSISLVTGQADSEVILIESGWVYYRAADVLYKAEIGERELGKPVMIAQDDAIRDAHWAFFTEAAAN
ncbi:MAG: hypothetical protein ACK55F_02840 [Acidobacteriota bacterium]